MQLTQPSFQNKRLAPAWSTLARTLQVDWAYVALDKRDLRLDFLRGFAVFAMVVDHWGGASWFYLLTGGNTFFVSAAEGFIFISGLVVGMVYGGIALKEGLRAAQIKALRRAWTLYKLTVVLTILFTLVSVWLAFPWAKDLRLDQPINFLIDVVTLHQTIYLTDIPLVYTFMMLVTPIALWLLVNGRARLIVVSSFTLWSLAQLFPGQVQIPWTISGSSTFDLAAWQLLFFLGIVIGFYRDAIAKKLSAIPRTPYFVLATLLFIGLHQFYDKADAVLTRILPGLDANAFVSDFFQKSTLAPGRVIASFIVFQFAYLLATLLWKPLQNAFGWLLLPLGQNALYSYTMHIAILGTFAYVIPHFPGEIMSLGTVNTCVQLVAVLGIWLMIQRKFLFSIVPR